MATSDPINVQIVGQALEDFGFVAFDTFSGVGLNTFGFLWAIEDIWTPIADPVTTTWTVCQTCGC